MNVIWKSISSIFKDNLESNFYKCLEEAISNKTNYFDELYEKVVLNTLDELEEEEKRNDCKIDLEDKINVP